MTRKMKLYCVVFIMLILPTNGKHYRKRQVIEISIAVEDSCRTPKGESGSCISLHHCQSLYTKLNDGNRPADFFDYLQRSHCRFEKFTPIVCCPDIAYGHHTTIASVTRNSVTTIRVPITRRPTTRKEDVAKRPVKKRPVTRRPVTRRPVTKRPDTRRPVTKMTEAIKIFTNAPAPLPHLPQSCGVSSYDLTRIIGGREAMKGSWPWLAALGHKNRYGHIHFFCGGAILTNEHILTAAHCLHSTHEINVIRLGAHDLTNNLDPSSEDFQVSRKISHEDYNSTSFANDIAILTIERPLDFKDGISPVCLPSGIYFRNTPLTELHGFIAGWGAIGYKELTSLWNFCLPLSSVGTLLTCQILIMSKSSTSSVLLEAIVPIQEIDKCKQSYARLASIVIGDRQLCAGSDEKDACQGDSGGPLMVFDPTQGTFSVAGIVSYGHKCAVRGFPGVYTRITSYMDWIHKNLN